jgi:chemotaxis protein CheD
MTTTPAAADTGREFTFEKRDFAELRNRVNLPVKMAMTSLLNRVATNPMPGSLPGFQGIRRYWDPTNACWTAMILPGEFYVTREAEAVTTVLGSCISACIRDPQSGFGGMNHFMLPEEAAGAKDTWHAVDGGASTRYGVYAMERLVNELLKLGARRERLEIKLFGGAHILPSLIDVGQRNIAFAQAFLKLEGFKLAIQDVGEKFPRRVVYFPATGRVLVKHLRSIDCLILATRETHYRAKLETTSAGNDVELFN